MGDSRRPKQEHGTEDRVSRAEPCYQWPASPTHRWCLWRDKVEVLHAATDDTIASFIHSHHSYSVDHALKYEGYRVVPESEET